MVGWESHESYMGSNGVGQGSFSCPFPDYDFLLLECHIPLKLVKSPGSTDTESIKEDWMVSQVGAYARVIDDGRDADRFELVRRANSGVQQDVWRAH